MATHRVAKILAEKGRFTDEEIQRMSEDEAWRWIRENLSDTPATTGEHETPRTQARDTRH